MRKPALWRDFRVAGKVESISQINAIDGESLRTQMRLK